LKIDSVSAAGSSPAGICTERRISAGSRPIAAQASSSCRDPSPAESPSRPIAPEAFQTSACRAVRRRVEGPPAPIQIGGYGFFTGVGVATGVFLFT